ncbi:hypothetical protein M427DRAFT_36068 [Gonapodya prolifera JEL478]|uniref:RNA-binding domain-containing protein n=1 Tax=Gonapodya prolifera (strain JEL478) TaxID=1344416 RepID=A0A139A312_GONPJ|nr:hypothetical protein M427DRAFT_36068 [Gonapodya prolifera JEL478]|eukprot:KXS11151.1 hypothetical protein M427DRAFT_36068 [Gonapodya prolifera JEL478]
MSPILVSFRTTKPPTYLEVCPTSKPLPLSPRDPAPPSDGPRDPAPPGGPRRGGRPVKLYVGGIAVETGRRDLEDLFARYGRVVALEIKHGGYGFAELENLHEAEDVQRALNGYRLDNSSLIVEFSKRSGPSGKSTCFICGHSGHWVPECEQSVEKGMDVRSGKNFKCGEPGHLAKGSGGGHPPPPRNYGPPKYSPPGGYGGGYDLYYPPPPPRGGDYRDDCYHGGPGGYRSPPRNRSRSPRYSRGGSGGYDSR